MFLIGANFLAKAVGQGGFSAKAVLNANGAIFFSTSQQHRDQKADGISYEDNYEGNALAAMLAPGKIEIRFHKEFTDRAVTEIIASLLAHPDLGFMKGWKVLYQGRTLTN